MSFGVRAQTTCVVNYFALVRREGDMKLSKAFSLMLSLSFLLSGNRVYAEQLTADRADNSSGKVSAPAVNQWKTRLLALPRAAAGVVYGVSLGVPIRMGKYIHSESHRMTETLLDDMGGPGFVNMALARSCAIPYGVASGTILGLIKGVQYGGEYGACEPFSAKSIGLGEPCVITSSR